jgi:ATP/maltotriose-dependent transcriptional regulator MalT
MLYGRDAERARIGELLDAARASQSGTLVIRGEPGIGKSALLADARERAADMHVLAARGVESESELPFAALHQLIRPALEHIEALANPQARALRSALGLSEGDGQERFLVFAACLSLLSELAERRPVLCLVDDAHWLDAASADALQFVARRLDAEGIVMVFAARVGETHVFEASDLPELVLDGLNAAAAETLLAQSAGVEAAAGVRDLLLEQTRGNALALLEVPSVLSSDQLAGTEPLPDALPMTRQVEGVFLERVRRLGSDTQRLLLLAAADDSESVGVVAQAEGRPDVAAAALDEAERAGLIGVRGTRLEFRHPLVRSAVYGSATSTERRAAHRALADALGGDAGHLDRRAWHLAAAALEPDDAVVRALEEAAGRAESRVAYKAAARAYERAADLSADDRLRGGRLVDAARCASVAGADDRAAVLASRALPLVDEPLDRAAIAQVLGLAEIRRGRPADAVEPLLRAAREIRTLDPAKALELLLDAAWAANETADAQAQIEAAAVAATIEPSDEDDASAAIGDLLGGLGAIGTGQLAEAVAPLERVVSWAATTDNPRHAAWAGAAALWLGDYPRAAALLERSASLARTQGAIGILVVGLGTLSLLHVLAQRFDRARSAGLEAVEFTREVGAENLSALPLFVLALVAAIRGDDDEAKERAGAAIELSNAHGLPLGAARPIWALAMLDLGRGRWAEALARLEGLAKLSLGMATGLARQTGADRVEAAVRAGDLESARRGLSLFDEWATSSGAEWARPRLESCRALLAYGDEASEHFELALGLGGSARPFDLARIHLLYGEHLRRERRRIDSRTQLRAALEAFEQLGAEPWAERARTELRASGETARKRDPSTLSQLTPQELQIARFVAEGLSNKEIAAQLFLSPRTVESHLRKVFSKLSITSRTQLARFTLEDELEPVTA